MSWFGPAGQLSELSTTTPERFQTFLDTHPTLNIDSVNHMNWTPLFRASQSNVPTMVRYLIQRGADVNFNGAGETTPLTAAAGNGHEEVVRILVDIGRADVNIIDREGYTALMRIARYPTDGRMSIARFLISRGADINMRNIRGQTALSLARRGAREERDPVFHEFINLITHPPPIVQHWDSPWLRICDDLRDVDPTELKRIILQFTTAENFGNVANALRYTGTLADLENFVNGLTKYQLCDGLVEYYFHCRGDVDPVTLASFDNDPYEVYGPVMRVGNHCYNISAASRLDRNPITRQDFTEEEKQEIEIRSGRLRAPHGNV